MKLNILSDKIPWFGKYSGYECLYNHFPKSLHLTINYPRYTLSNKIIGKLYQVRRKWRSVRAEEVVSERRFLNKVDPSVVSHILHLDAHISLLDICKHAKETLIGSIHLPFSLWKENKLQMLSKIDNVIILYDLEVDKFSKYISSDKIHVIKHGVDIDFFKPGNPMVVQKNKILFVGHFLRNFNMFLEVYKIIAIDLKELEFHFIIPGIFRNNFPELKELMQKDNVFFHEKLSDEELLSHYQTSYVLLMPMLNSGANTAIIQAIATGLPVITTDVGGIRSYGGNEVFPLIENDDVCGMADLFIKYYSDTPFRNKISNEQRNYAVTNLDWNIIAAKHINIYEMMSK